MTQWSDLVTILNFASILELKSDSMLNHKNLSFNATMSISSNPAGYLSPSEEIQGVSFNEVKYEEVQNFFMTCWYLMMSRYSFWVPIEFAMKSVLDDECKKSVKNGEFRRKLIKFSWNLRNIHFCYQENRWSLKRMKQE